MEFHQQATVNEKRKTHIETLKGCVVFPKKDLAERRRHGFFEEHFLLVFQLLFHRVWTHVFLIAVQLSRKHPRLFAVIRTFGRC